MAVRPAGWESSVCVSSMRRREEAAHCLMLAGARGNDLEGKRIHFKTVYASLEKVGRSEKRRMC